MTIFLGDCRIVTVFNLTDYSDVETSAAQLSKSRSGAMGALPGVPTTMR